MTLAELLCDLDSVDDDLTIYAAKLELDGTVEAIVAHDPPETLYTTYVLEVALAKHVMQVWSEWRDGAVPTREDRVSAVVHYARNDAYLPVDANL